MQSKTYLTILEAALRVTGLVDEIPIYTINNLVSDIEKRHQGVREFDYSLVSEEIKKTYSTQQELSGEPFGRVQRSYLNVWAKEALDIIYEFTNEVNHGLNNGGTLKTRIIFSAFDMSEHSEQFNCFATTIDRLDLADWLYSRGSLEKAKKLYPNFEPANLSTGLTNSLSVHPSGIQLAIKLYEECWAHLSSDMEMKTPSKDQLVAYAKSELKLKEQATIEAVIKLSTPNNERLGGMQKAGRIKPWRQKKDI